MCYAKSEAHINIGSCIYVPRGRYGISDTRLAAQTTTCAHSALYRNCGKFGKTRARLIEALGGILFAGRGSIINDLPFHGHGLYQVHQNSYYRVLVMRLITDKATYGNLARYHVRKMTLKPVWHEYQ
jgi:hypothetical protein